MDENDRLRAGDLPETPFADAVPFEASDRVEAKSAWPDPMPIRGAEYGPPLPITGLPDWAQAPARAIAENVQAPQDYVTGITLGVVSGGLMGRWALNFNAYTVHPNLNVLGALPSGERKSDPLAKLLRPVERAERELRTGSEAERALAAARRDLLIAKRKHLLGQAKKGTVEDHQDELASLEQRIASARVPGQPFLLLDDVTPEMAAVLALDNGGLVRIFGDEGPFLQHLLGRYSDSPAVELFLNGWAGGRTAVHRVSRPPIVIERVLTSVVAAVQPEVVRALLHNEVLVGRGAGARLLIVVPRGMAGSRRPQGAPLDRVEYSWFCDALCRLYTRAPRSVDADGLGEPAVVTLSTDASRVYDDAFLRVERRRGPGGDLEYLGNFVNKFEGHLLKVALVIWAAEQEARADVAYPVEATIPGEVMVRAVSFMEAQLEHQVCAVRLAGRDRNHEHAQAILAHVARHGVRRYADLVVSLRDLYHALSGRFEDPTELDEPLALLERLGWIRRIENEASGQKGRPPSPRVQFHPRAAEREE